MVSFAGACAVCGMVAGPSVCDTLDGSGGNGSNRVVGSAAGFGNSANSLNLPLVFLTTCVFPTMYAGTVSVVPINVVVV